MILGRTDESISIMKELVKRDPYSVEFLQDLTRMYLYAGQFTEAIPVANKSLELEPNNSSSVRHLGDAYLFSGDAEKAMKHHTQLWGIDSTYAPQGYIGALVRLGRKDEARKKFSSVKNSITIAKKAMCFIHLNEIDSALKCLDTAYQVKDGYLPFIRIEPHLKLLSGEPRYEALVQKMNFPSATK